MQPSHTELLPYGITYLDQDGDILSTGIVEASDYWDACEIADAQSDGVEFQVYEPEEVLQALNPQHLFYWDRLEREKLMAGGLTNGQA